MALRYPVPASVLAALSLVLTVPAAQAQAQTIFTDNFNTEASVLNYTGFANWNVGRGTVDAYSPYGGYGISVDMDGSSGAAGLLTTKTAFTLTPGDYTLSFALGKNGGNSESMVVRVGNVFTTTLSDALTYPTPVVQTYNFTVGASTTGAISFDHAGGDNAGFVIDDVSLVRAQSAGAAPEPGSLALLLPALGTLGIVIRRRRRK